MGATVQVTYAFNATGTAEERLAPTSVLAGGITTTNLTASTITPSGYQTAATATGPADGPTSANRFILSNTEGNTGGHLSVFFPNTTASNDTEAEVAALTHYFDIVISPAAGYVLDLTTLNLDYTASNDTSGRNFFVRYNHSGTSNNFTGPSLMGGLYSGGVSTWVSGAGAAGNLDGIPLVQGGESVTLRFFNYRTTSTNTAQNFRYDNIIITGELTAVPEPAAGMLAVAGAVVALGRRRRGC